MKNLSEKLSGSNQELKVYKSLENHLFLYDAEAIKIENHKKIIKYLNTFNRKK